MNIINELTTYIREQDERLLALEKRVAELENKEAIAHYKLAMARRKEKGLVASTGSLFQADSTQKASRAPFKKELGNKRWRDDERAQLIRVIGDCAKRGERINYDVLATLYPSRTRQALISQVSDLRRVLQ